MRTAATLPLLCLIALGAAPADTLDARLAREDPAALAKEAGGSGDPARGAALFFRPELHCARCHVGGEAGLPLGPDLSRLGPAAAGAEIVESILRPSKAVRKGFETVTVATRDGRVLTGLLGSERDLAVVVRDAARDGKAVTVLRKEIEARKDGGPSLMPEGLVNLLGSRQDFLDLVSYVTEVATKGPARALTLRPPPSAYAPPPLPDYERDIDHAGMIAGLGPENFRRGEAIYERLCVNCHGTKDRPGSLPDSPRFASAVLRNGADPFRLYQTLTHGFGRMAPQTWMVPDQKYDVVHYLREAFLKPHNPALYVNADRAYLDGLPKGTSRGPRPSPSEPWVTADYGPSLTLTVELPGSPPTLAYKGIAVRLDAGPGGVSRGKAWAVFDHDTVRLAGAWTGEGFIDWNGINFNGRHEVHPRAAGRVVFANPAAPGWADPETGSFDDPRPRGRDGLPYGPLPRRWARFRGTYRHGDRVVIDYTVGEAEVLEAYGVETDPSGKGRSDQGLVVTRTLRIGPTRRPLVARVAPAGVSTAVRSGGDGTRLSARDGFAVLEVPPSTTPRAVKLLASVGSRDALAAYAASSTPPDDLDAWTRGGPRRWPETLTTRPVVGADDGPFAADVLTHPDANPWNAPMRFSGFDFFPDGRSLAACTWDGDVWRVGGVDRLGGALTWQRIASGLFQPLGVKVVGGDVFVACRDQIVTLRDRNGDGEADFYECFNSDHQVTEHFHEFAMDLQTDAEGNFYYAKAARHGKTAVVPQHGTLLKVSHDGARTDILATGFRAPNGVCLNPDGSFFLTDQEGFWHPKNRINRVVRGGFYGNLWGYTDVTDPSDSAMEQPVCWVTNAFDRSPGAMVWVTGHAWGPLNGSVLNLSYGTGQVFVVPHETVGGLTQGGMAALPGVSFPTGVMRGRFHPVNGQLYLCGMFAWAGNREQPGGLYRLRATGKPAHVPIGLHARKGGLAITFSDPLDRASAADAAHYAVSTWSLKRTVNYGSKHHDEATLGVRSATPSDDGRTVVLDIAGLKPTWCMEVVYDLRGSRGEPVTGRVHNTFHRLGE